MSPASWLAIEQLTIYSPLQEWIVIPWQAKMCHLQFYIYLAITDFCSIIIYEEFKRTRKSKIIMIFNVVEIFQIWDKLRSLWKLSTQILNTLSSLFEGFFSQNILIDCQFGVCRTQKIDWGVFLRLPALSPGAQWRISGPISAHWNYLRQVFLL